MLQILQHIESLLNHHDFVVIPSLGGFVASAQPARYENDLLCPPSKKIGFNPTLTYNDGLLAQTMAQHNHCSLQEANSIIEQEVVTLQQQLRLWKHVTLGQLGCIHQTEKGIDFEPYANSIPVSSSYGLTPVYFPQIADNTAETVATTTTTAIKKPLTVASRATSRFAVACVAAILLLLMIPVNFTHQQHESMAMFMPPTAFEEVVIQPQHAQEEVATCNHYHVVIGSFNTQAKAFKFIKELPSSLADSKIIYSEHKFRIVTASYPTEELGNAGIEQVVANYPAYKDAWLLHYNP